MTDVSRLIRECVQRYRERLLIRELHAAPVPGDPPVATREVTYGSMGAWSEGVAAALLARGLRPGSRVAVLLENRAELVAIEWACLLSGLVWVALNVRTSVPELQGILDDCLPEAIIYSTALESLVADIRFSPACQRFCLDSSGEAWTELVTAGERALERGVRISAPEAEQPVRIRYTSGTAGRPKGAVLPRRSYDASVQAVSAVLRPLRQTDVVLQVAPMTHAAGAMLLPHAAVGARAAILGHFDPQLLVSAIETAHVTATFLVPTMLVRFLEALEEPTRVRSLRTLVYGGASMPVDRLEGALSALGPVLVQIYGLTESTWPVCALLREDHVRRPGESREEWHARLHSCGRPTSVGRLRIVDGRGQDVEAGQLGELWVRGDNTMIGYWAASGASPTDEKGVDSAGWMHTGDVGFVDADGFVTIVDRLHDMIVSGGFNVYPREVESALSKHPAVLESACVGRPDPEWGETVHAAVVLRPGMSVSVEELGRHCASLLAGYKKPRSFEFVEALPKNASGKILRRAVRDGLTAT